MLGKALAANGIRLVYGGGTIGIMGVVSNAAREHGGEVLGVIPEFLVQTDAVGKLDDNHIVTRNMHERKQIMFEQSDAFIALPGGIGTLEEIVEIMTWAQMKQHAKPMIFANFDGYWKPMIALLEHMNEEGFLRPERSAQPLFIDDPEKIVFTLKNLDQG